MRNINPAYIFSALNVLVHEGGKVDTIAGALLRGVNVLSVSDITVA